MVIANGTEVRYIACTLCGSNKTLKSYEEGRVNFTDIDPKSFFVLMTRVGGGLGSGFYRVDEKCISIPELKGIPEYQEILEQIKEQCNKILSELE